jgi:hypothetical protein
MEKRWSVFLRGPSAVAQRGKRRRRIRPAAILNIKIMLTDCILKFPVPGKEKLRFVYGHVHPNEQIPIRPKRETVRREVLSVLPSYGHLIIVLETRQ